MKHFFVKDSIYNTLKNQKIYLKSHFYNFKLLNISNKYKIFISYIYV
jgi:hypothetical protein